LRFEQTCDRLIAFVQGGKGLVGLQPATDGAAKTWPGLAGALGGTIGTRGRGPSSA
jgi:hypothetical protein